MIIFYIIMIIIGAIVLHIVTRDKEKSNKSLTINNITKTEMMADMYKDITGDKLDSVEKSILFMHNSKKK